MAQDSAVRFRRPLVLVLLAALWWGLAGLGPLPVAAAAGSATITGSLTRTSGAASTSTTVAVTTTDGAVVASVVTATDGSYSIGSLPAGTYRVRFTGASLVTQWYGGGEEISTGTVLSLADGESLIASAIVRVGGLINGTITQSDGSPLPNIQVTPLTLVDGVWKPAGATVRSHYSTGAYSVRLTTANAVKLRADTPKFSLWSGSAYSVNTSTAVQVHPEQSVPGVDFQYPATATVGGMVTNSEGGPLYANAHAYVRDHGEVVPIGSGSSSSKATGYTLTVPAGVPVTVRGTPQYSHFGETFVAAFLGDVATADAAAFLQLAASEGRYGNNVALQGGQFVRGAARDAAGVPVPDVTVTAFQGSAVVSRATTGEYGHYALPGMGYLSLGDITIRFTGEHIIEQWYAGAATQASARAVGTFHQANGIDAVVQYPEDRILESLTAPTVSGTATPGAWVHAIPGTWNKEPAEREFWWYCDGQFTHVGGQSYGVMDHQVGCQLSVREVALLPGYQSGAVFSSTVSVRPFGATAAPKISGSLAAGRTLSVSAGSWTFEPHDVTYQWVRDGFPISGATTPTYRLTTADVGRQLKVRLEATRWDISRPATSASAATAPVKAASALSLSTRVRVGQVRLNSRLTTPGTLRPSGVLRIMRGTTQVARFAVSASPKSVSYTHRGKRGWRIFTVAYSGSTIATPVSRRVRVFIR